ncbi:hypothetical protein KAT55_01590 [Candidatus Bathyarchaeota archaeon]|nr:hypothetical protein [Candidatus Bathyarchaeota archaeon]
MVHPMRVGLKENGLTPARKASMLAVMTAAAVATNYVLIGVVNVKFMDLIVFTGGYLYGSVFGATLGALIWLVYGTVNPYGFNLPILAATVLGEMLYGVAGGTLRGGLRVEPGWGPDLRLGVVGFLLTFVYDLFTNVVSAFVAGIPISVALISGVPFAIMHELSNAVFFAVGLPPLLQAIRSMIHVDE